ncbi:MAG: putative selenate reductase subunit YgfK, partial [Candidatus Bipolaricaulota bacterium]|nr:putative selenate reductase subunit YgfK [Candidatus Bipolaricaulota bacterium]
MSKTMRVQPFELLLHRALRELKACDSIFGLPRPLFYVPKRKSLYVTESLFGEYLSTPIGPAAGPHTQLAQNIVSAWLSGGRFIELKTVQIMDTLEIPRPCIDMEDEGYNVEWSQELRLDESADEYVKAWALVRVLHRLLGFENTDRVGTVFNMSVGYNLEGIKSPPMTRFMDRLADASQALTEIRRVLEDEVPRLADVELPSRLVASVTLSTMHGCPPDEIERIGRYLLEERGLHTVVKLNPTLLGKDAVMRILHDDLGYREIEIPDAVFAHDLEYGRAVKLIRSLKKAAAARGLVFAVKLSNTLAMSNHKGTLSGNEMYLSGRALYPITMALFSKLVHEFDGDLAVSYSAGADAWNVATILACGARPVTVASDLLKPGGYSRFLQYLENLEEAMRARGARSLDELAQDRLATLERAAREARSDPRYHKSYHPYGLPKVSSGLELLDCIAAPCVEACGVCQDVPEYARLVAQGKEDRALGVILSRNPLPGITGYVCTHRCETRCTRNNYDEPVAIRALKRFAFERGKAAPSKARGAK